MANKASSESKDKSSEPPTPEVLKPQTDGESPVPKAEASTAATTRARLHRAAYRPSHKATFISLAVVVTILLANAGAIMFVMKGQEAANSAAQQGVTISSDVLSKLGVNRSPVGNRGTELVVGPNARFDGKVTIAGDVSVGGQLSLNGTFSAANASFARLEAGETALSELNVNGDATASNLNLRENLTVLGTTQLQGPLTVNQLMTVNNNMNVAGNLAVGGTLSARGFQASSLISDTTLTIGGHIITRGAAPSLSRGAALGAVDTATISGSDAAGTVAVNIGAGSSKSGIVAHVTFRNRYSSTPRVIVTAVGGGAHDVYVNRNSTGFSIGVGSLSPGGHAFDYIVMQ